MTPQRSFGRHQRKRGQRERGAECTATATDIPTDTPITLNLQDPDSMIFDRFRRFGFR